MAKRDVWVRVGDELVRGDNIVGITVDGGRQFYQTYKLLMKVTGHRDPLTFDSGIMADPGGETDKHERHAQVTALADAFVDTLARAAALPTGALVRLSLDDDDGGEGGDWVLTALG